MKNLSVALFICAVVSTSWASDTLKLDVKASSVEWLAEKVTGSHFGVVPISDGYMVLSDDRLAGGSATVNMQGLAATDVSGPSKIKLENHLKADVFFNVKVHPNATFKVTQVYRLKAAGKNGENVNVLGEMTIKGITKPINFHAKFDQQNGQWVLDANFTVDRTLFDITYKSANFFDNLGDKIIYDDIRLTIHLVALPH